MSDPIQPVPDVLEAQEKEASEKRMKRFHSIPVKATPEAMTMQEYDRYIAGRYFKNRTVMDQVEKAVKMMMCHACLRENSDGSIRAYPFFVAIENDELHVFDALAHLTCHHCGFEEFYPTKKPAKLGHGILRDGAGQMNEAAYNYRNAIHSGVAAQANNALGGGVADNVYDALGVGFGRGVALAKSMQESQNRLNKELNDYINSMPEKDRPSIVDKLKKRWTP